MARNGLKTGWPGDRGRSARRRAAGDADDAGDGELAAWFRELSASDRQLDDRAKTLLTARFA